MPHATKLSPQQLTDAAKAPFLAYGKKDWEAVRASITPDFVYDEVATQRKAQGVDAVSALWRGWATALPDSAPTFHSALVSGDTVVLELTWRGTHTGPLETPGGSIAATGKRIELRACNVIEIAADTGKAKLQRQYFDMATLLNQLGVTS
jgi:steroid delta-isomerase-like uncharacterized protein